MSTGDHDAADRAMARYASGEDAAFETVVGLLSERLHQFLRRLTGSPHLADDLAQETWFKMHQARGQFSPGMPVLPWAYAIARNCYLDFARSARRRPLVLADADAPNCTAPRADASADAEQQLIARQTAEAVERALSNMTVLRREAFVLLRYEGLSVEVAAQVLGASESAVKLRAFQAYQLIREELAKLEVTSTKPAAQKNR